jgi:hypothetical protein
VTEAYALVLGTISAMNAGTCFYRAYTGEMGDAVPTIPKMILWGVGWSIYAGFGLALGLTA